MQIGTYFQQCQYIIVLQGMSVHASRMSLLTRITDELGQLFDAYSLDGKLCQEVERSLGNLTDAIGTYDCQQLTSERKRGNVPGNADHNWPESFGYSF